MNDWAQRICFCGHSKWDHYKWDHEDEYDEMPDGMGHCRSCSCQSFREDWPPVQEAADAAKGGE